MSRIKLQRSDEAERTAVCLGCEVSSCQAQEVGSSRRYWEKGCDAGMCHDRNLEKKHGQFQKQMLWSLPGHGQYLHLLWSRCVSQFLFQIFHLLQSRGHKGKGRGVSNHSNMFTHRENTNGAHLDLIITRQLTLRREHWHSRNFFIYTLNVEFYCPIWKQP